MITNIKIQDYNNNYNYKSQYKPDFTGYIQNLSKGTKFLDKFLQTQENLSTTRFIQGTLTNWFPKAILSRSVIDLSEFTFLESLESIIFYFAAPILGEHGLRKGLIKAIQPKNLKNTIDKNFVKSVEEIKNSNLSTETKTRLINSKAGAILACTAVPACEYALGFAKNLFTLKVFKVSDFNKVANLDKKSKEDTSKKEIIEKHSKSVLKKSGLVILSTTALGSLLAIKGHSSKVLSKISQIILEPGQELSKVLHKIGINSKNTDEFLKEYLKLDFNNNNGKLSLSKGQLAVTCTTGLFGYLSAAKDRNKLDVYEVLTRVPLVVLYTIFGSSLLDGAFKKLLAKNGKFPELIKSINGEIQPVPTRNQLPEIAEKLAKQNNTTFDKELSNLIKQKSVIIGVPYLFSLIVMGFTLSGISRLWTQYRYNCLQKSKNNNINTQTTFNGLNKNFLK